MNAIVIIDTDALTPAAVFAPGGVEGIISKLETDVRAIDRDISTEEGREAVKSLAYKVARSKTALDEMGKDLVAGIKKQAATIDAERRIIRDRLDALKNEVRDPLTAWETAEETRISEHERLLVDILQPVNPAAPSTDLAAEIKNTAALLDRDWQEFKPRADEAIHDAIGRLETALDVAIQRERDAAELAELRRLKAERDEQDANAARLKAESERIEKHAAEQAERQAREQAEAAERERVRAEQQAERDRQTAERAEAEKIAAAGRAVEMERQRVAAEKARDEAAEQKRQANASHRATVHKEITLALSEVLTGNADEAAALIEAIATGKIPHIRIEY
jgi:colicin import membrane protein